MEKYHGHTLDYWKINAEEDYIKTPISVLKYITCLEEHIKQLNIPDVVGQREQFCCDKCGSKEIEVWNNHSNCKKCLNVW